MSNRRRLTFFGFAIAVLFACAWNNTRAQAPAGPDIPRVWDDTAVRELELPLATPSASPKHVSAEYYYNIPERPIYASYAVYYPGREPSGYMRSLEKLDPVVAFDAAKLKTDEDWIRAGEMVFDAPIEFMEGELLNELVRTKAWYAKNHVLVTRDGVLPNLRYVIREKGKVEIGILACGHCHTRVMPDGTILKGAQGNFPDDRTYAYETRIAYARAKEPMAVVADFRSFLNRSYAAPWLSNDPMARAVREPLDEVLTNLEAVQPGTDARQGSSIYYPARIPDLIGLRDRKYFDASGLVRHRSIGDLMRYAALNQGLDVLSSYGDFRPRGTLPEPVTQGRYSDAQLYALARFLYSLEPPKNPNRAGPLAKRGERIFQREGCASCHTPPLYTNNMLTPAEGFEVPEDHPAAADILPISLGTDTALTLRSRRGTGFYKVPTLRGVWYRGPFGHGGWVATLEDWFNPRRLRDDYVPTAFRGAGVKTRAVQGHEYGLKLPLSERRALIAFLKTL